jgi:hypothetical protein
MGNTTIAATTADKILDQFANCLNEEAARRIVELKFDDETLARVELLGDKANEGLLSDEESEEYKSYVEIGDVIALLKLKAKQVLTKSNGV